VVRERRKREPKPVLNHPEFHKGEATLMSSRNATRADFDHVISSLKKGFVDPSAYITHRVVFAGVEQQFESWLLPETGMINKFARRLQKFLINKSYSHGYKIDSLIH